MLSDAVSHEHSRSRTPADGAAHTFDPGPSTELRQFVLLTWQEYSYCAHGPGDELLEVSAHRAADGGTAESGRHG